MPSSNKPERFFARLITLSGILVVAMIGPAQAQQTGAATGIPTPQNIDDRPRADWSTGSWGSRVSITDAADPAALPPFGTHLFHGGFRTTRSEGMNTDYRVVPGDQINLRVWGAIEVEQVLTVDSQGKVFIPGIGPVAVQGTQAGTLNDRITAAIKTIYPENVEVYTNLQGIQPVAIYVTGFVNKPGRYAGVPTDSLLYFLAQADGIDPVLGSFREIEIIRDGRTIASADLYNFLLQGSLPRPQFQDGDTLIVREKGPSVAVTGNVARPASFELRNEKTRGRNLLELIHLQAGVSHVLLRGSREGEPISHYLPMARFAEARLQDGDRLLFSSDTREEHIVVQLEGSFFGPSRFVLPRDAHLHELLDAVAVPRELTATGAISVRRPGIAAQQKRALEESLQRLESTYLGASSSSPEEAQIRAKEAELISAFVQRAREVETTGRLVVAHRGEISNIRLRDGDVVTIPEISDSIQISGEVVMPQSTVFRPGGSVAEYIASAGGYSPRADRRQVLVVHANGEVVAANIATLGPGDEILVLPRVPTKNLQLAANLTQILFQLAVATRVVLDL